MIPNASTSNRIGTLWLLSSFVFAAGALFFFPCLCGHLGVEALPASVGGAATVAVPLARAHLRQALNPSLAAFCMLFAGFVLLKNLLDVLWFDHQALWK
jgi:hypothetical protein